MKNVYLSDQDGDAVLGNLLSESLTDLTKFEYEQLLSDSIRIYEGGSVCLVDNANPLAVSKMQLLQLIQYLLKLLENIENESKS